MASQIEVIRAYRMWALDNPSKATPTHYAVYSEMVYHAQRRNSASVLVDGGEYREYIGVKDNRSILSALDDMAEGGIIRWVYRSKNGKKEHEIVIINFKREDLLDDKKSSPIVFQSESKQHPSSIQDESKAKNDPPRVQVRSIDLNNIPPIVPQVELVQGESEGVGVTDYEVFISKYVKSGDPFLAKSMWNSYSEEKRQRILASLDGYFESLEHIRFKQTAVNYFQNETWRQYPPKPVKQKAEVYQDIERKDLPVKAVVPYFFLTNTKL